MMIPYSKRLSLVKETLFKIQGMNSKVENNTKFQDTWKWMEERNRFPSEGGDKVFKMIMFKTLLVHDLMTGEDGFGGKNPPHKLTQGEISTFIPIILNKIEKR